MAHTVVDKDAITSALIAEWSVLRALAGQLTDEQWSAPSVLRSVTRAGIERSVILLIDRNGMRTFRLDRIRARALDVDLAQIAGASTRAAHYRGQARAVVDEDRGVLVGATFVGEDAAEMLHAATIAVVGEVPLHRLWHAVPAYPTLSEVWLRWLEAYGRESAFA